jgi:hypothetical protein
MGKLPVCIIEEMSPATEDPYTELKSRIIKAYDCSRWEKLDSVMSHLNMGPNERPLLAMRRLNAMKPKTCPIHPKIDTFCMSSLKFCGHH